MSGFTDLQEALPRWVRLERRHGDPTVKESDQGNVHVVEINGFPEEPPGAVRADVHFVVVAPTEGFPTSDELVATVRAAAGPGEFQAMSIEDLAGGPSFIPLGAWLGSQDLALMLIGAVELAGIADAITPEALGFEAADAAQMAGNGFVMLGPSRRWSEAAAEAAS